MTLLKQPYWFLRHGETDWNAQHLSQGRTDIPLNERGLAQAERAGRALAARFADGKRPFTHVVASPLQRALLTAQRVCEVILASGGPALPLRCDTNLLEVCFGKQEGKPMGDWYDSWVEGAYVPEEGEVFADLRARAIAGVNAAFVRQPVAGQPSSGPEEASVPLIVAHGALFRALRSAMGLPANVRLANATPIFAHYSDGQWILDTETLPSP